MFGASASNDDDIKSIYLPIPFILTYYPLVGCNYRGLPIMDLPDTDFYQKKDDSTRHMVGSTLNCL